MPGPWTSGHDGLLRKTETWGSYRKKKFGEWPKPFASNFSELILLMIKIMF